MKRTDRYREAAAFVRERVPLIEGEKLQDEFADMLCRLFKAFDPGFDEPRFRGACKRATPRRRNVIRTVDRPFDVAGSPSRVRKRRR